MEIKPYNGKYLDVTKLLYKEGYLTKFPHQVQRVDLKFDEGIDIVYDFKKLSPAKFEAIADLVMLAAYSEAMRYKEQNLFFAKIEVELNRTEKGKGKTSPVRDFIAAKHHEPDIMVYGEDALGYTIPEGYRKPFLINRIKDILDIPESPSPGPYVKKIKPYKVTRLVIAIRKGPDPDRGKRIRVPIEEL